MSTCAGRWTWATGPIPTARPSPCSTGGPCSSPSFARWGYGRDPFPPLGASSVARLCRVRNAPPALPGPSSRRWQSHGGDGAARLRGGLCVLRSARLARWSRPAPSVSLATATCPCLPLDHGLPDARVDRDRERVPDRVLWRGRGRAEPCARRVDWTCGHLRRHRVC